MSDVRIIPVDGIIVGTGPGKGVAQHAVVDSYADTIKALIRGALIFHSPIIPESKPGLRYAVIKDTAVTLTDFSGDNVIESNSDTIQMPRIDRKVYYGFLVPVSLGKVWSVVFAHIGAIGNILNIFNITEEVKDDIEYYMIVTRRISHSYNVSNKSVIIGQGDLNIDGELNDSNS